MPINCVYRNKNVNLQRFPICYIIGLIHHIYLFVMNRNLFLLSAIVLIVLTLSSCSKSSKYSHLRDKPLPVHIMVIEEGNGVSMRNYVGEIGSNTELKLQFPLGGELQELNIHSGQKVKKGQVLARVDATQAESMYESAKAVLAQAEDGYERLKPVYKKGGVSEIKWKEIETDLQKARSVYVSSRKRLDDCTLHAPMDGVVQVKDVEVGQSLAPTQAIGTLLDMNHLTAVFMVPENEVGNMVVGQKVMVAVPSLSFTLDAIIKEKDMISTQLAHTYKVTALLSDDKRIADLLPGMVCKTQVTTTKTDGIIIPSSCIMTQKQGLSVWVLKNGRAERTIIKVSEYVKNGVMVSEGLCSGDTIVVRGYQKLFNGANVEILD